MDAALASSLPYAFAIALSGLPIVAIALVLVTTRPGAVSVMFPLGWAVGVMAAAGVIVGVVDTTAPVLELPPTAGGIIRLALGALVGFLAVRAWRARAAGAADVPPKGIAKAASWSASRALTVGFALGSVNPKNLALTAAGATAILEATTSPRDHALAVVVFAAVASVGVAAPSVLHAVGGESVKRGLARARSWMEAQGATISAVVLTVIAAVLIASGIAAL